MPNLGPIAKTKRVLTLLWTVAFGVGAGYRAKIKIFLGGSWLYLMYRMKRHSKFSSEIRILGHAFLYEFEDFTDFATFREVLLNHSYGRRRYSDVKVILDLGSNIGLSVLFFRSLYPDAVILGFEPNPENFHRLDRLAKRLTNVQVFNIAIMNFDGATEFFCDPIRGCASSLLKRRDGLVPIMVDAKSLDTILEELHLDSIDLLKFDIEGAEYDVFREFNRIADIRNVIGEVHGDLIDGSVEDFLSLFEDFIVHTESLSKGRFIMYANEKE